MARGAARDGGSVVTRATASSSCRGVTLAGSSTMVAPVRRGALQDGVAFRVGRQHRVRGRPVALEEGAEAGEHRVRGHGGQLQQPRHRSGEREGCRMHQVVEAPVLGLREDVGEGVGAAGEHVQHLRALALEQVEVLRSRRFASTASPARRC